VEDALRSGGVRAAAPAVGRAVRAEDGMVWNLRHLFVVV